ncbi:MAG TPA: NADH-quinone oxidoreductase subunit NuoN [Alphaproteobacteria bacterium]|jgi:NADH-quinone oxidoreductase subunit N
MTSFQFSQYIPAIPEGFLALSALALLMVGVFKGDSHSRTVGWLAVLALAVTALLVIGSPVKTTTVTMNGLFVLDSFARFTKVLVILGSALSLVISFGYVEREKFARPEYSVLFLLATLGMLMMLSANDLMSLYVGLELQSLALYVTAAIRRDSVRATEAGLKYFVLGALSSGMLLYGASLVYGFAGTTAFAGLAKAFAAGEPPVGVVIGLAFMVAGLAFKVSAVPFHMWTPDVYEGAPTSVTAFFATAPKVAAMGLLVRVLAGPFLEMAAQWQQIVVFLSIVSMLLGAFAAISQTNIKRLMAYSSIGHVGYMLVGLAAANEAGIRGVAVYLAIYLLANVGTFGVILCMRVRGTMVENISDLRGLSRTNPMLALALAIFMFSMAGIPPLAGFFAKLYVFMAAIDAKLYVLAVIGVLSSVVSAFYYLRIVKLMYFDEASDPFDKAIGGEMRWVLAGTSAFTLLFFAWPAPLVTGAAWAAKALFPG